MGKRKSKFGQGLTGKCPMSVAVSVFSRDLILKGKMEKFYAMWLLFAGALACGLLCDCAPAKQYACSHSPHLALACDAFAHTVLLFSLLSGRGRKERGGGEGGDRQTDREREREGIGEQEGRKSRKKECIISLVPRPSRGGEKKAWCTLFAHAC